VAGDEYSRLIAALELDERRKDYVRDRWLGQIRWMDRKAKAAQKRYYALRLVTIVGGVVVPALVSLNVRQSHIAAGIGWTTFAVSLLVALSAAVEEFFHYGDRWRNYRLTAELLKAHGWQFAELAGVYVAYPTHEAAFRAFAGNVEGLFEHEAERYVTKVVQERQPKAQPEAGAAAVTPP
jgi:Protein of unknown function (DUF4231)